MGHFSVLYIYSFNLFLANILKYFQNILKSQEIKARALKSKGGWL